MVNSFRGIFPLGVRGRLPRDFLTAAGECAVRDGIQRALGHSLRFVPLCPETNTLDQIDLLLLRAVRVSGP